MTGYLRIVRSFTRDVRLYLLAWALIMFGYFGIQGVLLNLYLLRLGYGPAFVGVLIGAGQLVWAIFALPAAALGARRGVRGATIAGVALLTAANGLLLLAESGPASLQAGWLIGSWMLSWAGASLITVNTTPYLMAITGAHERNHAFAVQQALISLMGVGGSLLAGVLPGLLSAQLGASLDQPIAYRYALWLTPLAYGLALLALLRTRPVKPAQELVEPAGVPTAAGGLIVFIGLIALLQAAGQGVVQTFFNVYLDAGLHVSPAQIGAIIGVAQLLPVLAALVTPALMARWGAARTFGWATLGLVVCLLPLALIPHWIAAGLGFMGVMAMGAIIGPARTIFSQEAVAPSRRATMSAATIIGLALGWSMTAMTGGYVIVALGYPSLFLLGTGLTALAVVLLATYLRTRVAGVARLRPT